MPSCLAQHRPEANLYQTPYTSLDGQSQEVVLVSGVKRSASPGGNWGDYYVAVKLWQQSRGLPLDEDDPY